MSTLPEDKSRLHAATVWKELSALAQRLDWIEVRRVETTQDQPLDLPFRVEIEFAARGLGVPGHEATASTPGSDTPTEQASVATWIDRPTIELEFPVSYPESPPRILWNRHLFHPNISSSGRGELRDLGLQWHVDMSSEVVLECIWDVLRGAHIYPDQCENRKAREWYERELITIPWDQRTFAAPQLLDNVIRYQRKPANPSPPSVPNVSVSELTLQVPPRPARKPMHFIDDIPPILEPRATPNPPPRDDGIHFID